MVRHAFTMIELIFAIVIIALIVVGVPQIIAQNDKALMGDANSVGVFAQEAIFTAAGSAAKILTHQWDSASLDLLEVDAYAKELNTTAAYAPITVSGVVVPLRAGNIDEDSHRRLHSAFTSPTNQWMEGIPALITASPFDIINVSGAGAYKCTWSATIDNDSGYVPDGTYPATGSATMSNSKVTVIKINSTGGACGNINNVVTLRIYAANIGEIDYAKRTF